MEWMGLGWLALGGRRNTMLINTGTDTFQEIWKHPTKVQKLIGTMVN